MINRLLLLFLSLFLLMAALPLQAQQQIYYYSNATNGAYNMLAANLTASNLVTVGSWGSNTICSNGGGISGLTTAPGFATYNPANAGSPALNVNITPASGYYIQVNTISVSMRRSSTGPAKARLAYSTDGGSTWIDNGNDYVPNNGSCGSFANQTWTLATPAYVCSGMLKVRIYYYNSSATSGTCQTANLRITGLVLPVTIPSLFITANPAGPVCAGTNVIFTAHPLNGGPAPVYTWRINGVAAGTNNSSYASDTLSPTDTVSCDMAANIPCTTPAPVSSNTLNIGVIDPVSVTINDTLCAGATYALGTQTLSATGVYTEIFTAANGCDSTVNLHLYVRPALQYTFADTLCAGATYNWGSQNLSASGVYNQIFNAMSNCDSTVTLNLFVRPAITHNFSDTVCAGTAYTWAGQSFTATGSYNHVFTASNNCDSTVTLNLFVRPAITHNFSDTVCAGTAYTWAGQSFTATGSYNHVFTASNNCDSTVTLNLFVRPVQHTTDAQSICFGTSYSFGGQLLSTPGVYSHVFSDIHGCDSTATLTLLVNAAIRDTVTASICSGNNYTWGAQVHNTSGTYNQTFTAANGCDSLGTLLLTVYPSYTASQSAAICHGSSYNLGMQNLTSSGTYAETFTTINSCDSVITLHLTVSPPPVSLHMDTAACGIVWFEGTAYSMPAMLTDTLTSSLGCDSIYRTVQIIPYALPLVQERDTAGCSTVVFEGKIYTQSTLLQDTLVSQSGCDSLVRIVRIHIHPVQEQSIVHEMCTGEQFTFDGQLYATEGIYPRHYKTRAGCDSTVNLEIRISPLPVIAIRKDEARTYCIGDSIRLEASGAETYLWRYHAVTAGPALYFDATLYQDRNTISLTGMDEKGCSNQTDLLIEAAPCCDIWMPSAFSPNADGLNDLFKPEGGGHPAEYVMQIFNRWGQTVFSSFNRDKGWDGTINGNAAEVADYYYRVTGKCVNGARIDKKGTCTLIR